MKRHLVQIPAEQVAKLNEIKSKRPDLEGFPLPKIVHLLLQERLAEIFSQPKKTTTGFPAQDKWLEYIREKIPLYILAHLALGVVRNSQEMIGFPFTRILVSNNQERTIWCNYKQDIFNIGDFLFTKLKEKKFAQNYYLKHRREYQQIKAYCARGRDAEITKLSQEELFSFYNEAYNLFKKYYALTWDVDVIDVFLEKRMKEKLEELMKRKLGEYRRRTFNENYSLLTTPKEPSYVNKEELELYSLAEEIQKDPELEKLFNYDNDFILPKISPKIKFSFQKLVEEFWWTGLGWASGKEKGLKDFIEQIKLILKRKENLQEKKQRYQRELKLLQEKKRRLGQELNFDQEILFYLEVFENYAVFHDYRKEVQMKSTRLMSKILLEIARRWNKKYEDLVWCWPEEIQEFFLSKRLPEEKISERKEAVFFLVTENKIEEYTGEEAIRRTKEELSMEKKSLSNFQGLVASPGKVTGMAKVCYSPQEALEKIKEGDILITSMTMPNYLPAMKKAAAIVTNEGGITSHAAIVSRELGKPCIVGTTIATMALNDGDLIEVNANHGTVKIIERKVK